MVCKRIFLNRFLEENHQSPVILLPMVFLTVFQNSHSFFMRKVTSNCMFHLFELCTVFMSEFRSHIIHQNRLLSHGYFLKNQNADYQLLWPLFEPTDACKRAASHVNSFSQICISCEVYVENLLKNIKVILTELIDQIEFLFRKLHCKLRKKNSKYENITMYHASINHKCMIEQFGKQIQYLPKFSCYSLLFGA